MNAIDTGMTSGHLTFADAMFLVALICAVVAAVTTGLAHRPREVDRPGESTLLRQHSFSAVFGWLAVASLALGFFVL